MADENKPDNNDDMDDLLSDFNDLFPAEDDDSEAGALSSDEEKDDSDSYLGDLNELIENPPEIDNDELILSVESEHTDGLDDEIALDEPISSNKETISDDEPDIQHTAEMAEHHAASTTLSDYGEEETLSEPPSVADKSPITKLAGMAVYILLVVALGTAGGSLWLTLQAQNVADYNRNSLIQLKEQQELVRRSISESQYTPLVGKNSSALRELDQRINAISVMVEGPLSQMNAATSEEVVGKLEKRLQQLEQNLAELKVALAKRPVVTTTSATPTKNSWALNLLSLSSKEGADEVIQRLERAGINPSLNQFIAKNGKTWYRVRVTGFASKEAAKTYASTMPKVRGIEQTWVTTE